MRHGSGCTLAPSSNGPARCGMAEEGVDEDDGGAGSVGLSVTQAGRGPGLGARRRSEQGSHLFGARRTERSSALAPTALSRAQKSANIAIGRIMYGYSYQQSRLAGCLVNWCGCSRFTRRPHHPRRRLLVAGNWQMRRATPPHPPVRVRAYLRRSANVLKIPGSLASHGKYRTAPVEVNLRIYRGEPVVS